MQKTVALRACGCALIILAISTTAAAQCEGIWWEYDAPVLTVHHDTEYNCAVFGFDHAVELVGAQLQIDETALAVAWAWCQCPYATWIEVLGLAPGDYTLRFAYGESTPWGPPLWWDVCVLPVTIPAEGARDGDIEFDAHAVGCGLPNTGVPDVSDQQLTTWGNLKSLYR